MMAILQFEPEERVFRETLRDAPVRLISAVTRVELSFVAEGRKGDAGRHALEHLLDWGEFEIVGAVTTHAELAIGAFRRFGKGRHPAALNIGDCFSYALAKATGQPLLFKGDDFARTDIAAALES